MPFFNAAPNAAVLLPECKKAEHAAIMLRLKNISLITRSIPSRHSLRGITYGHYLRDKAALSRDGAYALLLI